MPFSNSQYEIYFIELYRENIDPVVRFAGKFLNDLHLCEEIAQETFLRLYRKRIVLKPDIAKVRNYLFTVARNLITDHVRKRDVEEKRLIEAFYLEISPEDLCCNELEEAFIEGEIIDALHESIEEFPEYEQEIYLGMTLNGEVFKEISREKNISFYRMKGIQKKIDDVIRIRLKNIWEDVPQTV